MESLSSREFEVNGMIARGYQVKEIASMLFLSPYTVDTHIKNIKKKTGGKNLADLTRQFILSLDNPKEYFKKMVAILFLSIQISMTLGSNDYSQLRNLRSKTRTSKTFTKTQ